MTHTFTPNALYIEDAMPEFGIGGVISYYNTGIGFAYEDYIEIGPAGNEIVIRFDPEHETAEMACARNADIIIADTRNAEWAALVTDVESDTLG